MSALLSRQWDNCQFSVIGRKTALLSNVFGHYAFKEIRCCEHIFSTCQCTKDNYLQVGNSVGMGFMVLPPFLVKMVFRQD